jgi:O-antigen/teichoic acid export membrane protein
LSRVGKNVAAGFAGNAWNAAMSLAFVPLYIRFMGLEAYGLVGLSAILQSLFTLLDLGLTMTASREIARLSGGEGTAQAMRDTVRTLAWVFWGTSAVIVVGTSLVAPVIGSHWVRAEHLEPQTISRAVMLVGVNLAFEWPLRLYRGGMFGFQRHTYAAMVSSVAVTLRGGGAVLVLWLVSPRPEAFFAWQAAVAGLHTLTMATVLSRTLPNGERRAKFDREVFRRVWRFAAGVGLVSALGLVLSQIDKVVLSRLLPLDKFAEYTLAGVAAAALNQLRGPVSQSVFPRLTQLAAKGDQVGQAALYHRASQLTALLTVPAAAMLAVFSYEVIHVWTGNAELAAAVAPILRILVLGTAINSLLSVPYALQLSSGWTKLAVTSNAVALPLVLGGLLLLVPRYGAVGAASVWTGYTACALIVTQQVMHSRLLPNERWRWYFGDVAAPLVAAFGVAYLASAFPLAELSRPVRALGLVAIGIGVASVTGLALSEVRAQGRSLLRRLHKSAP